MVINMNNIYDRLSVKDLYNIFKLYELGESVYNNKQTEGIIQTTILESNNFNSRYDLFNYKLYQIEHDTLIVLTPTCNKKYSEDRCLISDDSIKYFVVLGSNDKYDWKNNVKFKMIDHPKSGGKIHSGFYSSILKFKNILELEMKNLDLAIFIGHSRGAALALQCATEYQFGNNTYGGNVCVSYGGPRLCDNKHNQYIERCNVAVHRVTLPHDLVCYNPPVEFGYEHPWFGCKYTLNEEWWHRFHIAGPKVHLSYGKVLTNAVLKEERF
jgi:hypothetical protein